MASFDRATLDRVIGGDVTYQQVFGSAPWSEACPAWNTPGDTPSPPADPQGSALLLPGQFDSYSRPEWSRRHARRWDHTWVFTAPNNTHNTLGYDACALSVRNAWVLADTPAPPDPTLCTTPPNLTLR